MQGPMVREYDDALVVGELDTNGLALLELAVLGVVEGGNVVDGFDVGMGGVETVVQA